MKTNPADLFSMLNDMFDTPKSSTTEKTPVRPYNSRAFELPKKSADMNDVHIQYTTVGDKFKVIIPEKMSIEDAVACLLGACKFTANELDLDENELSSALALAYLKIVVDKGFAQIKTLLSGAFGKESK